MAFVKPLGFVTVSTAIHTGCVIALLAAPQFISFPMGTDNSATVEFQAAVPLGEQTEIAEPVAKPEEVLEDKIIPASVKVAKAPSKPAQTDRVIRELPKKMVEETPQEEILPAVAVVPVAEESLEEVDPDIDEGQETLAATEGDIAGEDELEKELASNPEEEAAAEETPTAPGDAQTESNVEAQAESSTGAPETFGTSQGVRNFEDLTQAAGNRPPRYPEQARLLRQQGQVVLQYFVTSAGQVSNVKMVKSSGYTLLDQEALNSVSQYRYQPGQEGWTIHPVNFSLRGPEEQMNGRLRTSMK